MPVCHPTGDTPFLLLSLYLEAFTVEFIRSKNGGDCHQNYQAGDLSMVIATYLCSKPTCNCTNYVEDKDDSSAVQVSDSIGNTPDQIFFLRWMKDFFC